MRRALLLLAIIGLAMTTTVTKSSAMGHDDCHAMREAPATPHHLAGAAGHADTQDDASAESPACQCGCGCSISHRCTSGAAALLLRRLAMTVRSQDAVPVYELQPFSSYAHVPPLRPPIAVPC
jgi:hypothetical protein